MTLRQPMPSVSAAPMKGATTGPSIWKEANTHTQQRAHTYTLCGAATTLHKLQGTCAGDVLSQHLLLLLSCAVQHTQPLMRTHSWPLPLPNLAWGLCQPKARQMRQLLQM